MPELDMPVGPRWPVDYHDITVAAPTPVRHFCPRCETWRLGDKCYPCGIQLAGAAVADAR